MRLSTWQSNCWHLKSWNSWKYVTLQASIWINQQLARTSTCAGYANFSMCSESSTRWKNTDIKNLNSLKPLSLSLNFWEIDRRGSGKLFASPLRITQIKLQPKLCLACRTSRLCLITILHQGLPATKNRLMISWWSHRGLQMKVSDKDWLHNRNLYPEKAGTTSTRSLIQWRKNLPLGGRKRGKAHRAHPTKA